MIGKHSEKRYLTSEHFSLARSFINVFPKLYTFYRITTILVIKSSLETHPPLWQPPSRFHYHLPPKTPTVLTYTSGNLIILLNTLLFTPRFFRPTHIVHKQRNRIPPIRTSGRVLLNRLNQSGQLTIVPWFRCSGRLRSNHLDS